MNDTSPINEQITTHFGGEHWPEVFKKLVANEALVNAIWHQYQSVMTDGEVDLQTKELMGLCVAITKPNEYVIGLQQRRIRRVGVDEAGEQEAVAVAGFSEGLSSFAHSLIIDVDSGVRKLRRGGAALSAPSFNVSVTYVEQSDDALVQQVYDEIRSTLSISFVPNVFKAMAHQPPALQAKWESYKAVMLEGVLSRRTKELIAVAVSAVNGCDYCVDVHSAVLRQLGVTHQGLVETASVIDLFANLCTLAMGLRIGKRNF